MWRTGRSLANPIVGTAVSTFTPQSDIKALSGGDYRPYMYYGANTSNSAVAIFGYVTPIVGANVCYGGAPSGTVCGNEARGRAGGVKDNCAAMVAVESLPDAAHRNSSGVLIEIPHLVALSG